MSGEPLSMTVTASFDAAVKHDLERGPKMPPMSPLERSAASVESRWERDRKVRLMEGLGFRGTRREALLAYEAIRADQPPTGCSCGLCEPRPLADLFAEDDE